MSILSNYTNGDILDMFPRLTGLGASSFAEDADTYGDTLAEAIEDAPQGRDLAYKIQAIDELTTLLSFSDEDLDRASYVLISISPTEEVEEPPNWGRFPTLRTFWTTVLQTFKNDPEVQQKADNS